VHPAATRPRKGHGQSPWQRRRNGTATTVWRGPRHAPGDGGFKRVRTMVEALKRPTRVVQGPVPV